MDSNQYKRILKKHMIIGDTVAIVGRLKDNKDTFCTLDTGRGEIVVIEGLNMDHFDNPVHIEVRGEVKDDKTITFHDVNLFGDEKFDINNFHDILSIYLENFHHLLT